MNVYEIVNRKPMNYQEGECAYVVEQYIKERKGKEVKIVLHKNNGMGLVSYPHHTDLLMRAFNYAQAYFLQKQTQS